MASVRPALPADFEIVQPLLKEFANDRMRPADWRRMLFDLPWPVEEPTRGFILEEGGRAVGFLGTIFSAREVRGTRRRFCNLSSWVVRESHRSSSMQLLLPVLGLRTHTIVNLSASPTAHEIFTRLGFQTLDDHQVLVPPLSSPGDLLGGRGVRVTTGLDAIAMALDEPGRRILEDMRGTLAGQILVCRGDRSCHAIATRSRWKPRLHLAHVQYASDWDLLLECVPQVSAAFFGRLGTVGLRLDGQRVTGPAPRFAVTRALGLPTLFRPAEPDLGPADVDGLYTEVVNLRW